MLRSAARTGAGVPVDVGAASAAHPLVAAPPRPGRQQAQAHSSGTAGDPPIGSAAAATLAAAAPPRPPAACVAAGWGCGEQEGGRGSSTQAQSERGWRRCGRLRQERHRQRCVLSPNQLTVRGCRPSRGSSAAADASSSGAGQGRRRRHRCRRSCRPLLAARGRTSPAASGSTGERLQVSSTRCAAGRGR